MFVTLTLNPTFDSTLVTDAPLTLGHVHNVREETRTPGGKGVNVAKMIAGNGKPVIAGGMLGRKDAPLFDRDLEPIGIRNRFLMVPYPTRANIMIADGQGREIKVNRPGFPDLNIAFRKLAAYVKTLAVPESVFILSGSLPARLPADTYALLIRLLHEKNLPVVLDTSGPALTKALAEKPEVIKPNRQELAAALGKPLDSDEGLRQALVDIMPLHKAIVVSDGARGAWFASNGQILFAHSPDVPVIDTTGAGDTLLGQFCADYFPNRELTPAVAARAVAAGAASVEQRGTPAISLKRVEALADRVLINRELP